ncbi:MAG TPA: purine-nucleoside phosphorylase [Urbifossiella sp.]|jgi:purine-nucleoside phosphorylase|nr:purine-nucleoside phosphorylase [Urbifossiella sp.]
MTPFAHFAAAARALTPRAAVVLGSGLGGVVAAFRETASVGFADIPGLAPPTVSGHGGRLAAGHWAGVPVLVYFGRLHFYEGHPWEVVCGPVRVAADLGVRAVVQTNAVGGIHPALGPGCLMAVAKHLTLLDPGAWRTPTPAAPYSPRLLRVLADHEAAAGRHLLAGTYAALTGPCYETPAEIRALKAMGADAVGMSTAREAAAAAALGLETAAVSCITNHAAGLYDAPLDHTEVVRNAKLAADRLAALLGAVVAAV